MTNAVPAALASTGSVPGIAGKVAMVTGAASGLGRACAIALARAGAKVVASDRVLEGRRETMERIVRAGGEAADFACDVTNAQDVARLVDFAVERFGSLDIVINSAGITGRLAPLEDYDEANWDRVIAINLTGTFLCTKYAIAQMLRQGTGGAIVNISSIAGLRANGAGATAYTTSKHGVIGFTRDVALEMASRGIRVNALCPGTVETPMTVEARRFDLDPAARAAAAAVHPMGRFVEADEVAAAALFLCSDAASATTGHALPIDCGRSA